MQGALQKLSVVSAARCPTGRRKARRIMTDGVMMPLPYG